MSENVITEVQFYPVKPKEGLIGFASLVLNGNLYLSSIGVFTRKDGSGYRLTYPSKKIGTKNLHIFHPIHADLYEKMHESIVAKVSAVMSDAV